MFKSEFHLGTYFKDINSEIRYITFYIGIVSDGDFIDENAITCPTFFPVLHFFSWSIREQYAFTIPNIGLS